MKDVLGVMAIVLFILLDIAMNIALIFAGIVVLYYTWPIIALAVIVGIFWIKVTSKR